MSLAQMQLPPQLLAVWKEFLFVCCISPTNSQDFLVLVAQLCPTLGDPMDCSLPGSSVHGVYFLNIVVLIKVCYFLFFLLD